VNIKLITTTLIVLKRNYLTHDLIRHGLNAYLLICREDCKDDEVEEENDLMKREKEDFLLLANDNKQFAKVHKALRMINMCISDNLLKKWLERVITNLEWNKPERREFERLKRKREDMRKIKADYKPKLERQLSDSKSKPPKGSENIDLDTPFILPHEFIFLMCNSVNRLANINKLHKPDLTSDLYQVNLQEIGQHRKIHLLRPDCRKKAPHRLVEEALNAEAACKRTNFIGMEA
jgi:hypothetical protein